MTFLYSLITPRNTALKIVGSQFVMSSPHAFEMRFTKQKYLLETQQNLSNFFTNMLI